MKIIDMNEVKQLKGIYLVKIGRLKYAFQIKEDEIVIYGRFKGCNRKWVYYEAYKILISSQKTGFGYKKFLVCPCCKKRRTKLYLEKNNILFKCRSCLNENIYAKRCNIYDGGGIDLIDYKINKLLETLDLTTFNPETNPPCFLDFINCRPKYMRHKKFELICKQLVMLYKLKNNIIFEADKSYTAKEINECISTENIKRMEEYLPIIESSMIRVSNSTRGFCKYDL